MRSGGYHRDRKQAWAFFDGLELLEPGIVPVNRWRPGPDGPESARILPGYVAVGQKR